MWILPIAYLAGSPIDPDILSRFTELLAYHGIYALLAFFLIYQQRRAVKDLTQSTPENRPHFETVHTNTLRATYALMVVAIPIWIFSTFFYHPATVLWGNVKNLTQMTGDSPKPGEIFLDQRIAPLATDTKFYQASEPDKDDPSVITLFWALKEEGDVTNVPLVLYHRAKGVLPPGPIASDPLHPGQPETIDVNVKKRFTINLSLGDRLRQPSYDFQYRPESNPSAVGSMHLVRDGVDQTVPLEDISRVSATPNRSKALPILSWWDLPSVFAQKKPLDAATADRLLPLLASPNLKQQIVTQQMFKNSASIPWDSVRKVLNDPKLTSDYSLLVHNLSELVTGLPAASVPSDVRLKLATESYKVRDFKTATNLFNTLKDAEIGGDSTNFYYRGVSNLQTGNYKVAVQDLQVYMNKAPDANAKSAAKQALTIANQKAAGKK